MGIDAIALLRIDAGELPRGARVLRELDDGVLLYTGARFSSEPDQLALVVRTMLGGVLDRHRDERGILMIPDVAEPSGRTYDAVAAEIGEGGTWVAPVAADHVPASLAAALPGSLGALVGNVMRAVGPETLTSLQQAMMRGDAAALREAQSDIEKAIASDDALREAAEKATSLHQDEQQAALEALRKMVADAPVELSSPEMRDALAKVASELERNPEMLRKVSAQIFGDIGSDDDEEPS
jgi:hypothetical protein